MVVAYAGPLAGYVVHRNRAVPPERRVLTPDHLRICGSSKAATVRNESRCRRRKNREAGPPVNFTAKGGKTDRDNAANLLLARQSPGFPAGPAIDRRRRRASGRRRSLLDYRPRRSCRCDTNRRRLANHEPYERAEGDPMLAVFKTIGALNVNERRAKQEGAFDAEFKKAKRSLPDHQPRHADRRAGRAAAQRCGRSKMDVRRTRHADQSRGATSRVATKSKGIVLFAAAPGGGLSTTLDTAVRSLGSLYARRGGRRGCRNRRDTKSKTRR